MAGTVRPVRNDAASPPKRPVQAPRALYQVAEWRAVLEYLSFGASLPWFPLLPRGDGHPVLVLPGFIADDVATAPLRRVLRGLGYPTYGWALGRNVGPTDHILDGMEARLAAIVARHRRPVSLVGWSLGGMFARELARDLPDSVRQVVTLGSPFRMHPDDRSAATPFVDALSPAWRPDALRMAQHEDDRPALPVPSTAVYSRTDGVVRWHRCIDIVSEGHENVEVYGSHVGLTVNPSVAVVVADRLSRPDGAWTPFRPPCLLQGWYPRPVSWEDR